MKLLRILRFLVLAACALALVLGAAVGAGWLAVSHGWQRERLRSLVEAQLTSALADAGLRGRVRIGEISGPLYPRLTLHDVVLEREGAVVARVREAELELDLSHLYAERRVIVPRARISGAGLWLAQDARGTWPWQPEPEQAERTLAGERPFSLEFGDVELAGAELDAVWLQAGAPSHVAGTLGGELHHWVLPRAGDPGWPGSAGASLDVRPGLVAGRALMGARLVARLDGSKLQLTDSHLESTFGKVRIAGETDLAGWLDPDAGASADLRAEADALDLAVLLARPELAGSVGGSLRVQATHGAGTDLSDSKADVSLALAKSRVGRLSVSDGELRGSYDGGRWRLDRAVANSSAGRLTAAGSGDLERIAKLDAELEVADLAALAAVVGSPARGQARAKLSLSGPWRAPSGTLELQARGLRTADLELGSLELRARSTGSDRYRIEPLSLDAPKLKLTADGPVLLRRFADDVQIERAKLRLSPRETVSLAGRVSPTRVTGLEAELGHLSLSRLAELAGSDVHLGGEVSGSLRADGALPRPALRGHLDWSSPRLGDVEVGAVGADFATANGVLKADGRVVAAGQDRLRARLALPWTPRADLARVLESPDTSLEIAGSELELALLREFAPDTLQRLDGKLDVRVAVRGGTPEPTVSGELTVANASCDVPVLAQSFGPLDARLVLDGDTLRVDRFVLRAGAKGAAQLTGGVKLEQLRPASADLRLAIDDFPIRWQTIVQAHAFGVVTLRGPVESLAADGEIELRSFRYSLAGGTDPLLGEVAVKDSSVPERPKRETPADVSELWTGAAANVAVVVPKDGRVQGQGADLEIAGALVASKSAGGPLTVKGAIDSRHGSYRIRGKTFIVEQAHVAFVGRPDFDPDLDVRAMHRVRNVKVYALVRGRASAPTVQLSSDPPYPQDDVLALLLFGKTRDELGQQQAGQLQSAIAGTAGAAALDSLTTRLGLDIPIDTLEVDDSASTTGAPSTTVGVGGYVTEDIFVRYGRGIGPDSESNVRVDWRFRKRWSVETSISTRGDSSADLVWSYDY